MKIQIRPLRLRYVQMHLNNGLFHKCIRSHFINYKFGPIQCSIKRIYKKLCTFALENDYNITWFNIKCIFYAMKCLKAENFLKSFAAKIDLCTTIPNLLPPAKALVSTQALVLKYKHILKCSPNFNIRNLTFMSKLTTSSQYDII